MKQLFLLLAAFFVFQNTPSFADSDQDSSDEYTDEQPARKIKSNRDKMKRKQVGDISEQDQERVRARIKSKNFGLLGIGPYFSPNLASGLFYQVYLGYAWDTLPEFEIRLTGELAFSDSFKGFYGSVQLGAGYFFFTDAISPVVGAELGAGAAGSALSNPVVRLGFSGSAYAGMRFFRTSDIQIETVARISTLFGTTSIGFPTILGVNLNLLY